MNRNMQMFVSCILVMFGQFLFGCGGTDHTTVEFYESPEMCVPGIFAACWCESGATGHQICREDGMAYGHCECPDEPTYDAGTSPETSTQEDAGTEPDAETGAEADAEADAKADTQADAADDAQADAETDAEADAGSHDKLVIYGDGHPQSSIVIAGSEVWRPFSRYKACANFENVRIKIISPQCLDANNESAIHATGEVGVAVGGALQGTSGFTGGIDFLDVYLGNGFIVPAGGCVKFEIWAKMKDVQPHGVCTHSHCPRSGQALKIRVGHSAQDYWTDAGITPEWYGKLFIHAFGEVSGEQIYAAKGASEPNFMVVRKSKPVVTPMQLASTTLAAGEQEIARWQVGADNAGGIAFKQAMFTINKTTGVSLGNFRLYRGATMLNLGEFNIRNAVTAVDLKSGVATDTQTTVAVSLVGEEQVAGAGNVYSLRAVPAVVGTGNYIKTKFYTNMPEKAAPVTGYLLNNDEYTPYVASSYIFNVGDYSGCGTGSDCWHAIGSFVWSDLSEIPHNIQTQPSGGSRDWSTDQHIENLTEALWTLSN